MLSYFGKIINRIISIHFEYRLLRFKIKSKFLFSAFLFSVIVSWQAHYLFNPGIVPGHYQLKASTGGGMHIYYAYRKFLFFFKRTGYFPLGHNRLDVGVLTSFDSWLNKNKADLVNEIYDAYRSGERGKIFILWFDSLFRDSDFEAQYTIFNYCFFVIALFCFCYCFWNKIGVYFCLLVTVLMGSNLFQLCEVYKSNNIFSLAISLSLILMSLNSNLFLNKKIGNFFYLNLFITGVLLGAVSTVRSEPVILCVPIIILIIINRQTAFFSKILSIAILVFVFKGVSSSLNYYFDYKFTESQVYLKTNGAIPYQYKLQKNHDFWHPVFCGLGDFANRPYYLWDDLVAYEYVLPILRQKRNNPKLWSNFQTREQLLEKSIKGVPFLLTDIIYMNDFYDKKKHYFKKIEDYQELTLIEREKVLSDIKSDPKWYISILAKRLYKIFRETSGLSVSIGSYFFHVNHPILGFVSIIALIFAYIKRDFFYFNAIFFSCFLSLPAFLIYSGHGMTFYSVAHIFGSVYIVKLIMSRDGFIKGLGILKLFLSKLFLKKN